MVEQMGNCPARSTGINPPDLPIVSPHIPADVPRLLRGSHEHNLMVDNASSGASGGGRAVVYRVMEEQTHPGEIGNEGPTKRNDTSGATPITPTCDRSRRTHLTSAIENVDTPEDFRDLSPFVFVPRDDRHKDDHVARYDAEIDIPRPRTHSEVVRHRAAKSAAGRRREELEFSEVSHEPCSVWAGHEFV